MAVLLVSHDWGVIADLCSRAVVMYAGQVVETASVESTFRAPRHPYTRALLESNPHEAEPGRPLPTIGGTVPPPSAWPVGCHFAARCRFATDACRVGPIPVVDASNPRSGEPRTSRCIHVSRLEEVVRA
jgi:peptide/nickel transport system permease protein